ncbi:MAG: ureidoglycolate lyase [Neisseria sp.]|uniref:ureidoglycolate lyase n=1 Tax=Neisseria sp. TaxID=192066 RepID=UPI0026DB2933|nr:ureidoglycolate lyase [Neisseria sp.]MDO4640221.1 ureidoglycolate lyase [Neisseria sp.]
MVVAPNGANDKPDETQMRAFYAEHGQGVNYHAGTWHHPLLTHSEIGNSGDFIVVDRIGAGNNCDEVALARSWVVTGEYR